MKVLRPLQHAALTGESSVGKQLRLRRAGRLTIAATCWIVCLLLFTAAAVAEDAAAKQDFPTNTVSGVKALQRWYVQKTGLYDTTGWWNSANAITVLDDYSKLTGKKDYLPVIAHTFTAAQSTSKNYLNNFYDDEGWWALAWIGMYDLTRSPKYLSMAETIFNDMAGGWDNNVCGGGIWWSKDHDYKNAIANELFLSVAAHLATRVQDPAMRVNYLTWANREWQWFHASGMINADGLINDGLVSTNPSACVNNKKTTWTYNQGVILGGLAELAQASGDVSLLPVANSIANAAMRHLTDKNGVLHDECEAHCGKDGVQFKGIFVRNLVRLDRDSPSDEYKYFAERNALSILAHAQNDHHQFGQVWSGPFDEGSAGSQISALDALIGAAAMEKSRAAK